MLRVRPTVDLDPTLRYVTNGELRTLARCPRKWYLTSYRRLGPAREKLAGAASLGTRVHAALAAYYVPDGAEARHPLDVLDEHAARDRATLGEREADPAELKEFEGDVQLARVMVEGYLEWVAETAADAGLRVVAPEQPLVADPRLEDHPEVRFLAKLDVQAEQERDGSRVFVDHKTVPDFTRSTSVLHMDEQMLHYDLIHRLDAVARDPENPTRVDGALYNMLRKVKRTARATPPFYKRVPVPHSDATLQSYFRRVVAKVRAIARATEQLDAGADHRDVAWPNPTRDCHWDCEFYAVCPMFDDGSRLEDFLASAYVEVNPLRRYEPDAVGETR